jgi:hypothetical protein
VAALGLTGERLREPADVARHLVAVQSQDFGPACWSMAQRSSGSLPRAAVEELIQQRKLIRTHLLRPTWHFVLPDDLGWLLDLTGPRVQAYCANYYRREDQPLAVRDRATAAMADALAGAILTRPQLREVMADAGVDVSGNKPAFLLMNAELEGVICGGPRVGKQHGYGLVSELAPGTRRLSRDAAVAELVLRYFTSHGPATVHDMSWWSSLTLTDIRAGIHAAGDELVAEVVDGETYYAAAEPRIGTAPRARLLQAYDEYLVGYSRTKWLLDPTGVAKAPHAARTLPNMVFIRDTAMVGAWRAIESDVSATLEVALLVDPTPAVLRDLDRAAAEYGRYLDKPIQVKVRKAGG